MNDGNSIVFEGISIKESFCNILISGINVLNFFRRNILSLLELEDIFLPIDDLESSIGQNHANISRVIPSIFINCLFSVFGIFKIFRKDRCTSGTDFSSGRIVGREIVHFRDVDEFNLCCTIGPAYMSIIGISIISDTNKCCRLSPAITFSRITTKSFSKECQDGWSYWSCPRDK